MPTFRAGRRVEQNLIRFKNLLRQAEGGLTASGLRSLQVQALLEPATALLALFLSPTTFNHFRLPISFDELVVTTKRFHLKPLLTLLNSDGRFYLLAFSKNQVRLFQGSKFSLSALDLQGVPGSLAESLQYDLHQKQLQFHTGAPARGGKRDARFFGTGDADTDEKELILHFFRQLDGGLREAVGGERAPLVLAGVDYLLPIYHRASSYPVLMETGITGNPDDLTTEDLHRRAWEIVEPHFRQEERKAADRYHMLAGSNSPLASSKVTEVVPASVHGQVDTLFVAVGIQRWGDVAPDTGDVMLHDRPEPDDHDLLDFAAIHTLLKGGTVYAVPPNEVPENSSLAAVFRY
jgi:hypothetical protein